jgi:YHS domain-containing protein
MDSSQNAEDSGPAACSDWFETEKGDRMTRSRLLMVAVAALLLALPLLAQKQAQPAKPSAACPHMTAMNKSVDEAIALLEAAMASPGNINQALTTLKQAKQQGAQCQEMCAEKMCGDGHAHAAAAANAKVTDPVCGMTVDPASAPKSTYAGKTYYFCSGEDKAKFDKNPAGYVKKG